MADEKKLPEEPDFSTMSATEIAAWETENKGKAQPDPEPPEPEEKGGEKPAPAEPEGGKPPEGENIEGGEKKEEKPVEKRDHNRRGYEQRIAQKEARQQDRTRIRELELENLKLKAQSFQPLSPEQLEDLRKLDPDEYIAYRDREKEARAAQEEITGAQDRHVKEDQEEAKRDFILDIWDWAAEMSGEDVNIDQIAAAEQPFSLLPKKVQDFLYSDEYKRISAEVERVYAPLFRRGIFPTGEQIRLVVKAMDADGKASARAADTIKKSIQNAANGTSALNRIQPGAAPPQTELERFKKLTPEEVNNLGVEESKRYEAAMRGSKAA